MKRCWKCNKIINWDAPFKDHDLCRRHAAERALTEQTGLSLDDLPDDLPIENFIDEEGNLNYDGISAW